MTSGFESIIFWGGMIRNLKKKNLKTIKNHHLVNEQKMKEYNWKDQDEQEKEEKQANKRPSRPIFHYRGHVLHVC